MIDFDMEIFEAFEEAHSALLRHRDHDGWAHCECKVAQFLRNFDGLYGDRIARDRRRRKRKKRRAPQSVTLKPCNPAGA